MYQTLVFSSYILPAITFYLFLAWGLGDRLAGLAAAWLTLTFPFPLGGVEGIIIGLVGYQLAFGLNPLLLLAGGWLVAAKQKIWPWLVTGLLLAGTILLHPFQAIFPLGVLGLYALVLGRGWAGRLGWLAGAVLLSLGLTAFWWLPLIPQRHLYVPVVEGTLPQILNHFGTMTQFEGTFWLLAAALAGALFRRGARRWFTLSVLLGGAGMVGFIFFDYLFLVQRLNLLALDPVRLIPGVTVALFLALGLGLSELAWMGPRLLRRWGWQLAGLPCLLLVPWLVYSQVNQEYDFAEWMEQWQPGPDRTPIFLNEAEARYDLPAVWEQMAATPGRVLFTSYYGLLFDIPTSLKAATPYLTGREIIGGTFTHRSPVASYLWSGQANPPFLRDRIEAQDDKTLAGVSWEEMTDDHLFDLVRHFNGTLIVTTATDRRAQAFLDRSARFEPVWSNQLFALYQASNYEPSWAEAKDAVARVSRYDRTAIDVEISQAAAGARLLVKVAYHPHWQANSDGHPQSIEADSHGLLSIGLPAGDYTLHLRYQPGWVEWVGGLISLLTIAAAGGIVIYEWQKGRGGYSAGASNAASTGCTLDM